MTKPFDEDDDNDRPQTALERFRARVEEDTGPPDDDTDDEPPRAAARAERDEPLERDDDGVPVVQLNRREKKAARPNLMAALDEERANNAELRERMARLEGAQSVMVSQKVDKTDEENPFDVELNKLQDEQLAAYSAFMAKSSPTESERAAYSKKMREFESKKLEVAVDRRLAQKNIQSANPRAALQAVLEAENADVYGNPRHRAWASAYYNMQIANGAADSKELHDQAMRAARENFKLAPSRSTPPSRTTQSRMTGSPRGSSGSSREAPDETIRMTKPLRMMARAQYPGLPEEEAYRKWGQGAGRKMLAAMREEKG